MKSALVITLLQAGSISAIGAANAQESFTVEDSIELARFSDPYPRGRGEAKLNISPDGRYLAVVTTRGVIASDQLESKLLIFDLSGLAKGGKSFEPDSFQPIRSVTVSGKVRVYAGDYGSLISSVKWGSRPGAIYYLAEAEGGRRDLYRLNVDKDRSPERISDGKSGVASFGERSGRLVFASIPPYVERPGVPDTRQVNASAYDITGANMAQLIVPQQWDKIGQMNPDLYILAADGGPSLVGPISGAGMYPAKYTELLDPAISQDGRHAIVLATAPASPPEWQNYERIPGATLATGPATEEGVRPHFSWPIIYAIADLEKGTFEPLANAPITQLLGYRDLPAASWSEDGKWVVITGLYHPLKANGDHAKKDRRPCAVAIVEVANKGFSCLLESRSGLNDKPFEYVSGVRFIGKAQLEVMWSAKGAAATRLVYERKNKQWNKVPAAAALAEKAPAKLDIVLKQDFNVPPALWLKQAGKPDQFLWTPTPDVDLSKSAVAKEFVWSDSTGHQWKGTLLTPPGYERGVKYPLIVQTHSGYIPNEFFTDGAFTSGYAGRPLADAGFVVLQMHNRSETWMTDQEIPAFQAGLDAAIDKLADMGLVDAARVGLIGFSRTAHHVRSVLVRSPDRYAVAAITDGIDHSYMQELIWNNGEAPVVYGTQPYGPGLKKWMEEAPGFNLHRVKAPLMVTAITLGSVLMEWEVYASLKLQGKPVTFLYIPDGQHVLQNPLERLASQGTTFDWFRFWLQGVEDNSPDKAGQYESWRSMRSKACAANQVSQALC
ncbi:prolyl oligopeptidase family serine peptidase [Sphingorhabdus contaminans]|nr:prolyl oligopeptidase family serine peptidase [Sphingorhabdus contaminans]